VARTEDGAWRIARILPGESSVFGARSPLAAPGVAAAPGDLIVAVNGRPVHPELPPNALLVGAAGRPVELTFRRDGADRRAVVVPLPSEHAIRYHAPHDWAAGRDPQLDTAVRLALQALKQRTPAAGPTV
jgi:tricorn protease